MKMGSDKYIMETFKVRVLNYGLNEKGVNKID